MKNQKNTRNKTLILTASLLAGMFIHTSANARANKVTGNDAVKVAKEQITQKEDGNKHAESIDEVEGWNTGFWADAHNHTEIEKAVNPGTGNPCMEMCTKIMKIYIKISEDNPIVMTPMPPIDIDDRTSSDDRERLLGLTDAA